MKQKYLQFLWVGYLAIILAIMTPCLARELSEEEAAYMERNLAILSGQIAYPMEEEQEQELLETQGSAFDEKWSSGEEDIYAARAHAKMGYYLFYRLHGPYPYQDREKSKEVFKNLVSKALSKIVFQSSKLWPFDEQGTCTAMALDFLARYLNQCHELTDEEDITFCIAENFRPFYIANTVTFVSRQAAYNTITVPEFQGLSADEVKYRKMQSLANYHRIKLIPKTGSIQHSEIAAGEVGFKQIVNDLPKGCYVIRALSPTDNDKQEYYGHTMIFIKGENFAIFYDNAKGAVKIHAEPGEDIGDYMEIAMLNWHIPEYRIYEAKAGRGGCRNLSTEASF